MGRKGRMKNERLHIDQGDSVPRRTPVKTGVKKGVDTLIELFKLCGATISTVLGCGL